MEFGGPATKVYCRTTSTGDKVPCQSVEDDPSIEMECICGGNLAAVPNLAVRGSCGSEKRTPPLCSRPEALSPLL